MVWSETSRQENRHLILVMKNPSKRLRLGTFLELEIVMRISSIFHQHFFTHKKNYFTFSSSRQVQASELKFELLMYIWWPNSFNFMLTSPWFFAIWQIQMFVYKYSLLCLQKWRGETNVFKECTKKHNWVFVVDRVFSNL